MPLQAQRGGSQVQPVSSPAAKPTFQHGCMLLGTPEWIPAQRAIKAPGRPAARGTWRPLIVMINNNHVFTVQIYLPRSLSWREKVFIVSDVGYCDLTSFPCFKSSCTENRCHHFLIFCLQPLQSFKSRYWTNVIVSIFCYQ